MTAEFSGGSVRLQRGMIVIVSAVVVVSGCGGAGDDDGGEAAAATVTVTQPAVTVTPPAETVTETVTVEPTGTTSEPPRPTDDDDETESESGEETTTIELPPEGDELGLDDFFNPDGNWEEGRWNVADRKDEQGVSANSLSSRELELRLQNQFSTLRFDAGQANDSTSSECTAKVDVVVDGELRETREFGFNVVQEFDGVDVRDSNAVRIEVSLPGCNDYVRVVLSRIQVE